MGDVNINVPTATASKGSVLGEEVTDERADHLLHLQELMLQLMSEPKRISVCTRCGGYPKTVFTQGGNCVKGKCFDKFVQELLTVDSGD